MSEALQAEDLIDGHHGPAKSYSARVSIHGVERLELKRHYDDRGFFMEMLRTQATHPGTGGMVGFFAGVDLAQLSYAQVDSSSTVKGLHYHLKQMDVWFCPPPGKIKIVLWDLRKASPTCDQVQTMVLGGGDDAWVKIPPGVAHGYRPLSSSCGLIYITTRAFDLDDPDEFRIAWDHPRIKHLWEVANG